MKINVYVELKSTPRAGGPQKVILTKRTRIQLTNSQFASIVNEDTVTLWNISFYGLYFDRRTATLHVASVIDRETAAAIRDLLRSGWKRNEEGFEFLRRIGIRGI